MLSLIIAIVVTTFSAYWVYRENMLREDAEDRLKAEHAQKTYYEDECSRQKETNAAIQQANNILESKLVDAQKELRELKVTADQYAEIMGKPFKPTVQGIEGGPEPCPPAEHYNPIKHHPVEAKKECNKPGHHSWTQERDGNGKFASKKILPKVEC